MSGPSNTDSNSVQRDCLSQYTMKRFPQLGVHVTYTITDMETGYKHSVTIFLTDKNTKVELTLPAQFKYGSLVNMTMEETFPYKFKDLGDGEYTGLGDAGMSVSFNLTPPRCHLRVQSGSRAI